MKENEKKELMGNMRKKRLKKYALTALALVIVVSVAVGFKLEDRDAKLPDGQGEIVLGSGQNGEESGAQDGTGNAEAEDGSDTDKQDADQSKDAAAKKDQAQADANKEKTKPAKNIPKRRRRSWMPRISKWTTRTISLPPMTAIAR